MNNATFAYFARKYFSENNPVDFIKKVIKCTQSHEDSNSDTVRSCVNCLSSLIKEKKCEIGSPTKVTNGRTACLISFPGKGDIVIWYKEANKAYKNARRDYGEGYGRVELGFVLNNREKNKTVAKELIDICKRPLPNDIAASDALIEAITCIQGCKV